MGITWFQAMTLAVAAIGAVLGLVNTLHQLNKDKVMLKVIPKQAFPIIGGQLSNAATLCIEIINISTFPVTVSDAGLVRKNIQQERRLALVKPILIDGGAWPRRLETRQSVTVYFDPNQLDSPELASMKRAYVKTDCGEVFYGKSPALKSFILKKVQLATTERNA